MVDKSYLATRVIQLENEMNFDEAWERVSNALRWRKLGEMAEFLGITSQSVSGARNRGVFPIEWAFKIGQEFGLSTEWILTGTGPGGPGPLIDEDFFVRVVFAVENILKQRSLNLSFWQKIRIYIYVYENTLMSTGDIDPETIKGIISLAATNATIVDEDSKIINLVEELASEASTDNEKVKICDEWLRKISKKFLEPGFLASLVDKGKIIDWLKSELKRQKTKSKE